MSASALNVCIELTDLVQIVQSVFSTMIGLEIAPCSEPWLPDGNRLTSAVHLSGDDWNGVVLLECERHQACAFAARFLSIDTPDAVDDIVRDVLGELANMIGGNLKCVLTRGIALSMPSVVDGGDYRMRFCRAQLMLQCAFDSADGVFWVSILTEPEKNPRMRCSSESCAISAAQFPEADEAVKAMGIFSDISDVR
jgi:chemotaxis protein CheX